ncbi:MAG: cadmium-translocating P-type ATPase [Clostridiales bacterium]|nr:cadmium-translocating P-type ATPase [Clostridiales bacterium]
MSCHCGHCHNEHEHHHDHHDEGAERKKMLLRMGASALLLALGLLLPVPGWVEFIVLLCAWGIAGYPVVIAAIKNILKGHAFDEMFLMTVASIGAFCLGEYFEGVAVMLLYQVGEFFQDYAVDKSRDSIADLMDIRPESATVERDEKFMEVSPEDVRVGDIILVRPGEKVPLDGVVLEGESMLDTAALTGESQPRKACKGDRVISGCVNLQGAIRVQVTHAYVDSTVTRILELVEHSAANKSKTDRFITRFAKVYTPAVVLAAALLAVLPPLFLSGNWREWISSALTFLVISCPCALVISVPLTFFAGIGGASRKGVLMKGANYLEMLARVDTAVFDKTGTLTKGIFSVTQVHAKGMRQEELLSLAASAEQMSNHPIAKSLREACPDNGIHEITEMEEIPGQGIRARVDGKRVAVGNEKMMKQERVAWMPIKSPGALVHVAVDGSYAGCIVISDEIKRGAKETIAEIKAMGIQKTVMLTGDAQEAAEAVAKELQVDDVYSGLLPDGKVEWVEKMLPKKGEKGALIFVGDGINDAPVLARADVGVAMGALGSDAAIEAADVVLMDDDPRKLPMAIALARRTLGIVRQNIGFSLGIKAVVMVLGIVHLLPLWAAVFADVGVCLLAILNAMRAAKA